MTAGLPSLKLGGGRLGARRLVFRVGGAVLVGFLVLALLFRWNWLRGPLAWVLERKLHRPVAIAGDLHVHPWSAAPWASIDGLTIGDARTQANQTFAFLPRLTVGWRWLSLMSPRPEFPLVWAEHPSVSAFAAAPGAGTTEISPTGLPRIDHLVITGGSIAYVDAGRRLRFNGHILTDERLIQGGGFNDSVIKGALVVGSPAWAGPSPLLDAQHLLVRAKLLPLMAGKPAVSLIKLDHPVISGVRDAAGRTNWQFSQTAGRTPAKVPPIGRLVISGGVVRYQDARLQLNFVGSISTNETVTYAGRGTFLLQGGGTLRQAPFTTRVGGGPLVDIDPHRPYPFDALVESQGTRVTVAGSLVRPFDLRNVSGTLRASGPDLADLYRLTGVALPNTPPYDLATGFARAGSLYALRNMAGRVGASDVEGNISIDDESGRPSLTADLSSRRLDLTDLSAVVGGVPGHAAGHALSPLQRRTAEALSAEHRVLPDTHLDVGRIRSTDADVTYRARAVEAGRFRIRGLLLKVALHGGQLSIDPLTLTLPQGNLAATAHLDARRPVPAETMDVRLTDARLENLVGRGGANPPLEGGLFARARLSGRGDSVRSVAASVDGDVRAVIPHGEIRQTFAELMGIDATKALLMLITKDKSETPVRCAVADFHAQSGVLTARTLVFDTGVVLVAGKGDIDLRDEALDLRLNGRPKKFRLVRIGAPITVKGSLSSPKFGVDVGKAAGQLAIGGLLGAVVAPLTAVLPFISPGLAKNADCAALVREADPANAPPPPT